MSSINRRRFLQKMSAGLAASMLVPGLKANVKAGNNRKNVLFIAVDDLRTQLNCYGKTQIKSPNIDRLSEEGLTFNNAFCQHATCGASRASLLTGLRDDSTGIIGLYPKVEEALPEHLTMPQNFKNNGYQTISLGKIYHQADDDKNSWSKKPWCALDKYFGRGYITSKSKKKVMQRRRKKVGDYWIVEDAHAEKGPATEMADVPYNGYSDGELADRAVKELRNLKNSRNPFFLGVGFRKPHLPFCAPKKFWDMYNRDEIDLAGNPFFPKGVTKYTMNGMGELEGYADTPDRIKEGGLPEKIARRLIHGYNACVSYIDFCIGLIINELEILNLREDTIIVLLGDHGWKLGEHGAWAKHTNFEIDTRVPLIIDVPGMQSEGVKSDALVELVDLYPTLCDLCELTKPDNLEVYSFTPLLKEANRPWKEAIFSQYPRSRRNANKLVMGYTVRTEKYRYVEWVHVKSGKIKTRELYDRSKDPRENTNVIDNPAYKSILVQMQKTLDRGWEGALPD